MGLLDRFKASLKKTRDALAGGLLGMFRGKTATPIVYVHPDDAIQLEIS